MNRDNKQLFVNMSASILAFIINTGIQFFVTPILSKNVGDAAYGFIAIANDFVHYASIFTVVLNSVSARFISVEIHKGDTKKAEELYSSVFIGNVFISIFLAAVGTVVVVGFDSVFSINPEIVNDVSILFAVTFGNYILSVLISVFTVSVYVKNRIDLLSIRNIVSYLVKLGVVFFLFTFCIEIKVYYLAIATMCSTLFLGVANIRISRRIMPEISVNPRCFKFKHIMNIIKTGIWMTINNLSNVIANNFTTIIININITAEVAGFYSVARTIPNAATSLVYAIYSVFLPTYYKLFAEEKKERLVEFAIKSMRMMAFICSVPILAICVKAHDFVALWQSYRTIIEIEEMAIVFVISLLLCIIFTPVLTISQLGLVTNKIKIQMINNLIVSSICLVCVYLSVKYTDWGVVGVALITLIIQGCKWLFFTPFYAAYVIKAERYVFFKQNIKIIIYEAVMVAGMYILGNLINCNSWFKLCLSGVLLCCFGYVFLFLFMLTKAERRNVIDSVKRKITKGMK